MHNNGRQDYSETCSSEFRAFIGFPWVETRCNSSAHFFPRSGMLQQDNRAWTASRAAALEGASRHLNEGRRGTASEGLGPEEHVKARDPLQSKEEGGGTADMSPKRLTR
jgi:hypothetical protein